MEKTKKVANLAGISATIMDDTLYQLSDVEQQFGIAQIELIQRASKLEDPLIKLCFSPPVETVIHVVDTAFICINGFNYRNRDPALPAFDKKVDQPQIFHNHKFIAMILSSDSCEGLRRTTTVEQSLFMEAYAISDFNKKPIDGSIKLVRPKMTYTQNHDMNRVDSNRLRFAAYPRWVNWQFSERNGFQPPDNITISRSDLCIYGSELKRFMEEVEAEVNATIEQNNENNEDTYAEAQASLSTFVEEVEETKVSTPVVNSNKKKESNLNKAQALFRRLAAEIIERAKENNIEPPGEEWPGLNEDIFAIAEAWAKNKENGHLMTNTTIQLEKYKRGIIACNGNKKESDYYLNLFPEYKDYIIQYRIDLVQKKAKSKKTEKDAKE